VKESSGFAAKPTLTGEKVVLRPFRDGDLPAIRAVLLDPEARMLTGSVHNAAEARSPQPPAEEALLLDWYGNCNDQPDRLDLAVVDKMTRECVGEAVLNQWDPGNESCNFRIFIGPNGRDRGLGTEATRLIVGHGFERLGLHRISLEVYAFNPRARRAYEKVGFRVEGVLRESFRYNGEWIDATVMSILASEWHHQDNSKKSFRTGVWLLPRACELSTGGGGNSRAPQSADTLVGDQSGTYRVPGVQAEDHLPPGWPTGRRVRCGAVASVAGDGAADVVAPRRTRLTGLFSFGTGHDRPLSPAGKPPGQAKGAAGKSGDGRT
jgi:RimJ/RimL family protein N-acetyltransferase